MVSIQQSYSYFSVEREEQISALGKILGQMSVFGIRARMPQQNSVRAIKVMDAINCMSKAELFIALLHVKI